MNIFLEGRQPRGFGYVELGHFRTECHKGILEKSKSPEGDQTERKKESVKGSYG